MPRRTLAVVLLLAALSVAAGLIAPSQPFEGGHLWVATPDALNAFEFDGDGELVEPAKVTGLTSVHDLAFGPDGALYATDEDLDQVLVFGGDGSSLGSVGAGSGLDTPTDLAFGPAGGLYVASSGGDEVLHFLRDGTLAGSVGAGSSLDDPRGLAFGPDGHLFVSSFGSDRILEFDASGTLLAELGGGIGLDGPWGLIRSPAGGLIVASHETDQIFELDAGGAVVRTLGAGTDLDGPTALALGPDRKLYVASLGSDEVLVLDDDGTQLDSHSAPTLTGPTGLAFSPFVMSLSLKGRSQESGFDSDKRNGSGWLSVFPGSGRAMVLLPEADDPLSDLFGSDVLVFDGFEFVDNAKTRHVAGQSVSDGGSSSIGLELKGDDDAGDLSPRKASGVIHHVGPAGVSELDIKASSSKKLPGLD